MELNGDGRIDVLSGSYSWEKQDMAGTFQVLHGAEQGGFERARTLHGSDGEPLIITATSDDEDSVTDKICTRPFAADLDGDGKLDLVVGNFTGTFAVFRGEGAGKFAPTSTWLEGDGEPLRVDMHSDPFLVDWDGDGDLDLLSGSAGGGVFLFTNTGTRTAPKFGKTPRTLLPAPGHEMHATKFGDAHLHGPQQSTRVWADDVNGDGKLDLLIGDQVSLVFPAEGVSEAEATAQLAAWDKKQQELFATMTGEMDEAGQQAFQAAYEALQQERAKIVRDEATGFVWVMYRK